jgi:anti-sigma regulatory factor (Ser/Thr protein kinase)
MPAQTHNSKPIRKLPVRDVIDVLSRDGAWLTASQVASDAGVSRQAAHRQLAGMVRAGVLSSDGQARATRYRRRAELPGVHTEPVAAAAFDRGYPTAGLDEDRVWRDLDAALAPLADPAAKNARSLLQYALTEMVNNAIDHSGAPTVRVRAGGDSTQLWFSVEDAGVGAFETVRAGLGLPDVLAGLQEISKGKRTTQPARHSGEGIFFTSKAADHFVLTANCLRWQVDNLRQDQAVGAVPAGPGTTVRFEVASSKSERLEEVFARYTHDFEFDTTRTVVKLFAYGVRFVSRSEAKRLLEGLDRFRHVVLDFTGVESVGQGFVDEVFRVWAQSHPAVELTSEKMSPPVAFMVGRARIDR